MKTTTITCSNRVQEPAISGLHQMALFLYVIWERMMGQEITDSGDNYQPHNIEECNGECMHLGNYGRDNILQRTIALEIVSRDGKFSPICQHTKRKDYDHIFSKSTPASCLGLSVMKKRA